MRPRNLPHWVISLSLPLSGVTITACTSDQEAGEMEEFDQGDSEEVTDGEAPMKKKKKMNKKKKKKKKMKTMKGVKKKKKTTKQAPAETEQGTEADMAE